MQALWVLPMGDASLRASRELSSLNLPSGCRLHGRCGGPIMEAGSPRRALALAKQLLAALLDCPLSEC